MTGCGNRHDNVRARNKSSSANHGNGHDFDRCRDRPRQLFSGTVLSLHGFVPQGRRPRRRIRLPPCPRRASAAQRRKAGAAEAAAATPRQRSSPKICAGCHGTTLAGGRAPSLFDDQWSRGADDESLARNIANGIPTTEMAPFKGALTEQQIWQLVAYIRTQAATLKGRPQYVPDPDNQVIKSEKQTFKIEIVARGIETPWGLAFLLTAACSSPSVLAGCASSRTASSCPR